MEFIYEIVSEELGSYAMIKTVYVYLLCLSIYCFSKSIKLGISMDSTKTILNPFLYVLHLTIWWLAAIQAYQCITLILSPLSINGWWVPMVCKHGSLIAYIIFLNFIDYRHNLDVEEAKRMEQLCYNHNQIQCSLIEKLSGGKVNV
jgi:hypothetical protein